VLKGGCRFGFFVVLAFLSVGGCSKKESTVVQEPAPPDTTECPVYDPQAGCANSCSGLLPLTDLGTSVYQGLQGGLYPGGENERPTAHTAAGLTLASQITPLDTSGNPDPVSGRIVLLSIGFSNSREEFERFQMHADTLLNRNPLLALVNGAQGGKDVKKILSDTASFWRVIEDTLSLRGLTPNQVQVIWFKQADAGPTDSSFPGYPLSLKEQFKSAMHIIKAKYPNAKLCYLASRTYGNYMATDLNREPWAYYTGWAAKMLIEDQINGDPSLAFVEPGAQSPWLSWGVYLWADGMSPRNDGLTWNCPDDYKDDFTHMSDIGREKVAQMLLNFFTTDATTVPWFLK
jgi:hypothetical protein